MSPFVTQSVITRTSNNHQFPVTNESKLESLTNNLILTYLSSLGYDVRSLAKGNTWKACSYKTCKFTNNYNTRNKILG